MAASSAGPTIDHVVVLMLENRSFDHLLGWPAVEGLHVPFDPRNPAAGYAPVFELTAPAAYTTRPDPGHAFDDVTLQLFGGRDPLQGPPLNDGFILSYAQCRDDDGHAIGPVEGKRILGCVAADAAPVVRRLAQEFVVCDRWFSSVPGPTWPNRDFVHAGTSMGGADSPGAGEIVWGYPHVRTIYDNLAAAEKTWKVYYHDVPQVFWFRDLLKYKDTNFARFDEFDIDARNQGLPNYSFIEPRYFSQLFQHANDAHPPHDLRESERLIARIYDSLRHDDTVWNRSLFILVYDEHGGFYDHVAPPAAVNPDGLVSTAPAFAFDRLGVRVPALLVSPWVGRGTVDHTVYDHTSILGFVKKWFALPEFLHRRDAVANTFEHNFASAPRADTPRDLGSIAPALPAAVLGAGPPSGDARLSDYQKRLVALAASLEHPAVERDAAGYVAGRVTALLRPAPPTTARTRRPRRLRKTTRTTRRR